MDLVLVSFLFISFPSFFFCLIWSIDLSLPDFHIVGVITLSGHCRHVLAQYGRRNCAAVLQGFELLRRRISIPARSAPGPSLSEGFRPWYHTVSSSCPVRLINFEFCPPWVHMATYWLILLRQERPLIMDYAFRTHPDPSFLQLDNFTFAA